MEKFLGLARIAGGVRADFSSVGLDDRSKVFSGGAICQIPIDARLRSLGRNVKWIVHGHQARTAMKLAPLFFDLDHTLWDFEMNSRLALRQGFRDLQLGQYAELEEERWILTYERCNEWCWEEYRQGRMNKETLRSERFRLALMECRVVAPDSLPHQLGEQYLATSPHQTALIDGTLEVLQELQSRGHDMWLLTNGFDEVQHIKVENSGLTGFFKGVYTSDNLGVKKPHPEAFEKAAARANLPFNAPVIMIGDSLESDVKGAQSVGWRGVHFNPVGEKHPQAWRTIRHLKELLDLPLHV